MVVELVSVGTELLLGNIVNTNAAYLSEKCANLGLSLYYEVTVGDNEKRLIDAVETALSRSDLVILTGGLGPTQDDMTKDTVAKVLNLALVEDPHTKERIKEYFKNSIHKTISENNWRQAQIIEGCKVIDNDNGTAPGLIIETKEGKRVILLPGPPNEMIPMFEKNVYPFLQQISPNVIYSKMIKISGVGESSVETRITDLIDTQSNPTIATYAKCGEVHLRVTASAHTLEEAKELVNPVVGQLQKRFGDDIYTTHERESLEEHVVTLLKEHKLKLVSAESCTAGLFTGRLVNAPGTSDILKESFITYSDSAKMKYLNVRKETLEAYTAVSSQCAREMAIGAATNTDSQVAISITGLAGPDGGTEEKPVGLVYIGCCIHGKTTVKEYTFKGNRQKIRENAVVYALDLLRRSIIEYYK